MFLNEADVIDGFLGQILRLSGLCDVALPTLQRLIDHLYFGEVIEVARKTVNQLSVESIAHTYLDFLKAIENIELGQIERSVSVDEIGVANEAEIEPSTTTRAPCGGSEFVPTLSYELSSGIK